MGRGLTGRETLLVVLAVGISLLLTISVFAAFKHKYREGAYCFLVGGSLAYIFYRKRKVLLTMVALEFVIANAGLNNLAHPTIAGSVTTFTACAGLYLLLWWRNRKRKQMGIRARAHNLYDKDHGDDL